LGDVNQPEEFKLEKCEPASIQETLSWEKELLGLYISGHPLDQFKEKLQGKFSKIKNLKESALEGKTVVLGGIIEEVKKIMTKSGDLMAFVKVADYSDQIESVIFPKILKESGDIIKLENCIAIKGNFSKRNGGLSIVAEKVKLIS
jgi:DNA polymerase-3 subunit alpha